MPARTLLGLVIVSLALLCATVSGTVTITNSAIKFDFNSTVWFKTYSASNFPLTSVDMPSQIGAYQCDTATLKVNGGFISITATAAEVCPNGTYFVRIKNRDSGATSAWLYYPLAGSSTVFNSEGTNTNLLPAFSSFVGGATGGNFAVQLYYQVGCNAGISVYDPVNATNGTYYSTDFTCNAPPTTTSSSSVFGVTLALFSAVFFLFSLLF